MKSTSLNTSNDYFMKALVPTKIVKNKWWEHPPIVDIMEKKPKPHKDVLLIVGDAYGVMKDLEAFLALNPPPFDTLAINYSCLIIPWEIQHYVAGDSHMPDMQAVAKQLPENVLKHCWNPNSHGFHIRWMRQDGKGWNGTTANLAIRVGLAFDYLRLVLAGVPMDNSGNWYKACIPENDIKQGKDHRHHLWKWTEIAGRPIGRFIRSMSGNTADLFGRPTIEWLYQQPEGDYYGIEGKTH